MRRPAPGSRDHATTARRSRAADGPASADTCASSTSTSVTAPTGPTSPRRITSSRRSRSLDRQSVGGVGQAVEVQAATPSAQRRYREDGGEQRRRRPPRPPPTPTSAAAAASGSTASGASIIASPATGAADRPRRRDRQHGEGADGQPQAVGRRRSPGVRAAGIESAEQVGTSPPSSSGAARSTGSAASAPLPSPSRSPRSSNGPARARPAPAGARARSSDGRRTTRPTAPGRAARRAARRLPRPRRPAAPAYAAPGRAHQEAGRGGQVGAARRRAAGRPGRRRCGRARSRAASTHAPLARQGRVVDAGAAADDLRGGRPSTRRRPAWRPTVVLPMPMSPAISRSAPASISSSATALPAASAAATSSAVSASSRWIAPEPRRTLCAAHLGRQVVGQVVVDAEVEHPHPGAVRPRQHGDGRAAAQELAHHRRRHLPRVRRHGPDRRDAVVAGEHHHATRPSRRPRVGRALDPGQPDGQLLEPAQRARAAWPSPSSRLPGLGPGASWSTAAGPLMPSPLPVAAPARQPPGGRRRSRWPAAG